MGLKDSFANARMHVARGKHAVITQKGGKKKGESGSSSFHKIKANVAAPKD